MVCASQKQFILSVIFNSLNSLWNEHTLLLWVPQVSITIQHATSSFCFCISKLSSLMLLCLFSTKEAFLSPTKLFNLSYLQRNRTTLQAYGALVSFAKLYLALKNHLAINDSWLQLRVKWKTVTTLYYHGITGKYLTWCSVSVQIRCDFWDWMIYYQIVIQ